MTLSKAFPAIVMLAFAVLLSACTEGASDSPPEVAPVLPGAQSDGSVGGDIVALEVWYSESLCDCSSAPEHCITRIWDDDAIACVHDGYNQLAREHPDAADCVQARLRDGIRCMKSARCSEPRDDCNVAAYRAVVNECPLPDGAASKQLWSCFDAE
jgi:hypothetical protein